MLRCLHRCYDKSIPNKPTFPTQYKTTFLIDTDIETTPHVHTLHVHYMYTTCMYTICTLHVCTVCTLHVHYMYVYTACMYTACGC